MNEDNLLLYVLISMVVMLVFGLAVVWFLSQAQKKIIATKIKEQQMEIDLQDHLLSNTVKTQETERERIAKELHDDVSSKLNIINLNLHLLKSKITQNDEVIQLVDHIEKSLKSSSDRARAISHELMPVMLQKFGFKNALNELVNSINLSEKLEVDISGLNNLHIKDNYNLLHLYRILQELLNNTIKYAKASEVKIEFQLNDNVIHMIYRDNGIGFDSTSKKEGLGLGNIQTRVKLLKGEIEYESKLNEGLKVTCKIPRYEV